MICDALLRGLRIRRANQSLECLDQKLGSIQNWTKEGNAPLSKARLFFWYGFLRFSVNLLWRKLFFRSGRKQLGGPGADLRQICTWALLGFAHGHPAVPPRQLREAERQTEINELVQAHDIRPWIRT